MKPLLAWCAGVALAVGATVASAQTAVDAPAADDWTWYGRVYGWFPSAHAKTAVEVPGRGTVTAETNPGNYLSKLQFAFMGNLEARKGRWSFVADVVDVDFGHVGTTTKTLQTPLGSMPVDARVRVDLEALVTTLAGGYEVVHTPTDTLDVTVGARYLRLKTGLGYEITDPAGHLLAHDDLGGTKDQWDGVVGVRGRHDFDNAWFVPYYADVGTGSSRVTWQAFAGVGYHFRWGDVMAGYRQLAYDFKSGKPLSDASFGGPVVGVAFRF